MENEIKSCPFCGSKPHIKTGLVRGDVYYCSSDSCFMMTIGLPREVWNTRAEQVYDTFNTPTELNISARADERKSDESYANFEKQYFMEWIEELSPGALKRGRGNNSGVDELARLIVDAKGEFFQNWKAEQAKLPDDWRGKKPGCDWYMTKDYAYKATAYALSKVMPHLTTQPQANREVVERINHSLKYLQDMLERRLQHESEAEAAWCDDLLEHVKAIAALQTATAKE